MIFPAREFTEEPPKMQTLQTKGETFRQKDQGKDHVLNRV